jgi:hypothetical protein
VRWPWGRAASPSAPVVPESLDEFVEGSAGRDASPLDLARDPGAWAERLSAIRVPAPERRALGISAFSLLRGGDLYEPPPNLVPARTAPSLLERYADQRLRFEVPRGLDWAVAPARAGLLSVLAGHPAVCLRMLLAKPIRVALIPEGASMAAHGLPRHIHPGAIGVFYNRDGEDEAHIGLRVEHLEPRPWLAVHEMTHAVHLLGLTRAEREAIDRALLPVYGSPRWVEEAVAVHAERAFGARWTEEELRARDVYGALRRGWTDRAVFSRFVSEWLRPAPTEP